MGQSCSDNWYQVEFYDGEIFAALQPKKMVCHKTVDETVASEENTTSPALIEFGTVMMMQLYLGSMIIMFVLWRSCSRKRTDPFRLVFMYLIGTVGFAMSLNFGPKTGGFTRLLGWGVMLHNVAEWFIISRIWFGDKVMNAIPAVLYMIAFIILISLLPLAPLWFLGMFQGGFCDYLLVYSTIYFMRWAEKMAKLGTIKSRKKYLCAGVTGAVIHIISIQPLFFGMALAYSPLSYVTTLFILPTFVCYTYWASSGKHKVNLVSPGIDEISSSEEDERIIHRYNKSGDKEEMQRIRVADSETDQDDDEKNALVMIENGDNKGRVGNGDNNNNGKPNKLWKDVALDVIERGVSNIDPSTKKIRNFIFIAAFITSLVNTIIVYMAPCYADLSFLIDCD